MGRFLNAERALAPPLDTRTTAARAGGVQVQTPGRSTAATPVFLGARQTASPWTLAPQPVPVTPGFSALEEDVSPNLLHHLGLIAVCLFALSFSLNELLFHLFSGKSYLFYLAFPLSLLAWLVCGTMTRSLRTLAGKLWLFLGLWMIICFSFSIWRGGSWDLIKEYLPRCHLSFFLIGAFAISVRQCRNMIYATLASGWLVLLLCLVYGSNMENGRFRIPQSLFFENPNDLALQLITLVGAFAFLLLRKNMLLRLVGGASLLLTAWFVLKTASRGVFVACIVLVVVTFIFTKAKLKLALMILPIVLLVPMLSPDVLHRLLLIVTSPEAAQVETKDDEASVVSQSERQHLFWLGLQLTLTHPIVGVGPDMFVHATSGADAKKGKHSPALGTHNSYTQIGSECGIPGLACFLGVIVISIRKMLKLYRATTEIPELNEISTIAYSLLLSLIGFAVAAFFHHVAYTGYVSLLAGMSMATWLAAEPVVKRYHALHPAR